IYFEPQYCKRGVCVFGIRPIPKHCKIDHDCKVDTGILKILVYRYCDNGLCKSGIRPTIATIPTTQTTQIETTTSHQKLCRTDLDCARYGRHSSFFPQFYYLDCARYGRHSSFFPQFYCDHGICIHGRRPTIATPTTTELIPTTESAAPQTCQKDQDCIKQIGFQHKALVSVYCNEGQCALKPQENDATTTESTETSTAVINNFFL
uniref:Uncharacterized protein n=1 Tax=Panagrolaimus sp. PS1159 TaxID=55785 RepID=A0AC35FFU6_9BILA